MLYTLTSRVIALRLPLLTSVVLISCSTSSSGQPSLHRMPAFTNIRAISGDGSTAVGESGSSAGSPRSATRWNLVSGVGQTVSSLGTYASGVSFDGSVICGGNSSQAFRWTQNSGLQLLPYSPGYVFHRATAISSDGSTVVGYYRPDAPEVPFIWTTEDGSGVLPMPPGFQRAAATGISGDGSVTIGWSSSPGSSGARWTPHGIELLPGVLPTDASADGTVIVGYPFRWTANGGLEALAVINLDASQPVVCSQDGLIVVGTYISSIPGAGTRPFVWKLGVGARDLRDHLGGAGVDLSGWGAMWAGDISADGLTIAGTGIFHFGAGISAEAGWIVRLPSFGSVCLGDFNEDLLVNSSDISAFLRGWLNSLVHGQHFADANGDGAINSSDISQFLSNWLLAVESGC